jgi:hypothetical protein
VVGPEPVADHGGLTPTLKIVLTSGFPQTRLDFAKDGLNDIPLLNKPYAREDLAALMYSALHE